MNGDSGQAAVDGRSGLEPVVDADAGRLRPPQHAVLLDGEEHFASP